MPSLTSRTFSILFDMAGCPNRCRHCWLSNPPNQRIPGETVRQVARQFREWVRPGETTPFVEKMSVSTWYREPDFAENYRELWALEQELSDPGEAKRHELLSVWRLARDHSYAQWAREVGPLKCQITFFGLEANTDYFTRRKGAFQDNLMATERLLNVGILPRWQIFLTEQVAPELEAFVDLIHTIKLEERTRACGAEFEVFVNSFSPDGEGFQIEHLRPTVDVLAAIPRYLAEKTLRHVGRGSIEEWLGKSEGVWVKEMVQQDTPAALDPGSWAFEVTPQLDVFSNVAEPMPWWKLGNLRTDGLDRIMHTFEHDANPGLFANFHVALAELAQRYGRPDSRRLYQRGDIISRWLRMWGEQKTESRKQKAEGRNSYSDNTDDADLTGF